ncbi:MAG: hypothetical protein AAGA35_04205 [Patescibacteria group bacterium]
MSCAQKTQIGKAILVATLFIVVVIGAFYFAQQVTQNEALLSFLGQYGYFSVLVLAIISGLNAIVPVPAASFVPVFTEAGLELHLIILMLIIGTTIADSIGYVFGSLSRDYVHARYPKIVTKIETFHNQHREWVLPVVVLYAAVVPFPNEAIVIPLALLGCGYRNLLFALILGNTINQTALAYGATNIFMLLF